MTARRLSFCFLTTLFLGMTKCVSDQSRDHLSHRDLSELPELKIGEDPIPSPDSCIYPYAHSSTLGGPSACRLRSPFIDVITGQDPAVHFAVNADVEEWLSFFQNRGRSTFERWLQQGAHYKETMYAIMNQEKAPKELFFVAMIESGFHTSTSSPRKASGPWQFVPGTARKYGLKINSFVDERRDIVKSTRAAVRHFKDLYQIFGDWNLAMAAYNAGSGTILTAMKKTRAQDYWHLAKSPYLKKETRQFLPKVIAAYMLGSHPEDYGLSFTEPLTTYPQAFAQVRKSARLKDIATLLKLDVNQLKQWNPELIRGVIPPQKYLKGNSYPLRMPVEYAEVFANKDLAKQEILR